MSGGWVDDFADGWGDSPAPAPLPLPPAAPKEGARTPARRVQIIALGCPKCPSLQVRCTRRTNLLSYWRCLVCNVTWQDDPQVGNEKITAL